MTKFQPDRETGGLTNGARVQLAVPPLRLFARLCKMNGEDLETIASDLLADIAHVAQACGMCGSTFIQNVCRRATFHFEDETYGHDYGNAEEPAYLAEPMFGEGGCDLLKKEILEVTP